MEEEFPLGSEQWEDDRDRVKCERYCRARLSVLGLSVGMISVIYVSVRIVGCTKTHVAA